MADRRRILGSADRYTLPSSACCNNVSHFRPQSPGPSCPRLRPHQDLVCDVRRQTSHRLSVQPRAAERRRMADAGCYRGWNRPQRRGHTRAACCRRGACRRDGFSRASRVPPGLVIGPALTMALWRTSDCVCCAMATGAGVVGPPVPSTLCGRWRAGGMCSRLRATCAGSSRGRLRPCAPQRKRLHWLAASATAGKRTPASSCHAARTTMILSVLPRGRGPLQALAQ